MTNSKKKLAILNIGYFQTLYREYLIELCRKHDIEVDLIEQNEFEKNPEKYIQDYDYVMSDVIYKEGLVTALHGNTILERLKSINFIPYKWIFYIGHYKKIQQSKKYYASLKKIIAVSNAMKEDVQRNYNIKDENIIVAHAGFIPFTDEKIEIKNINLIKGEDTFTVSMSGVGFVKKGGYLLLKAIRKFKKLYPEIKIKANIIYPNYKRNLAVKLYTAFYGLKNNVEFFDYQKDVFDFYSKSHCFICPSILEPFGRVVTEAMYIGKPVIVGSNVGASDVIEDGINGFVFKADKNKELNLALKIKEVYDKYETLEPLINKAHDDCLKYTWENFAQKVFQGLYPELINKQ